MVILPGTMPKIKNISVWNRPKKKQMNKQIKNNYKIISEGIVSFSNQTAGVSRAFIVRDYEGHAILLFQ